MRYATFLFTLGCGRGCAVGSVVPAHQLSVEAVPGASTEAGAHLDREAMSYEELLAFTQDVQGEVLPDLLMALDLDERDLDEDLGPGGYALQTSPSLQLKVPLDDEGATRLAAALGLAWSQESVLVTDWSEGDGGTAFGAVRFVGHAPSEDEAQAFFAWAAGINGGLGGGYTAFDDTLYFLNLRGDDGQPYSGLEDEAFLAALTEAASTWTEGAVSLMETGEAQSWLVANDWAAAPSGEQYAAILGEDAPLLAAVEAAASEHAALLTAAAEDGGWASEADNEAPAQ